MSHLECMWYHAMRALIHGLKRTGIQGFGIHTNRSAKGARRRMDRARHDVGNSPLYSRYQAHSKLLDTYPPIESKYDVMAPCCARNFSCAW